MYSPPKKRCHVTDMQSTLLRSGCGHREIWPSITKTRVNRHYLTFLEVDSISEFQKQVEHDRLG